MLWDVDYLSPSGNQGILYATEANDEKEAIQKTPLILSASTAYSPDQFIALSARKSIYSYRDITGDR